MVKETIRNDYPKFAGRHIPMAHRIASTSACKTGEACCKASLSQVAGKIRVKLSKLLRYHFLDSSSDLFNPYLTYSFSFGLSVYLLI